MIRQHSRLSGFQRWRGALTPSRTGPMRHPCGKFLKRACTVCVKGCSPALLAALLVVAPAFADECPEFRSRIDVAIASDGYDGVVVAFSEAIDAWRAVQEADLWNPAADDLVPALAASKESADAASDTRDKVFRLQTPSTGEEDEEQAEIPLRSLDDMYHKSMIAFFELLFFAHCGEQPPS